MPTPYSELSFFTLLHHQKAFERIDKLGNHIFSDWNMDVFAKSVLSIGNTRFLDDEKVISLKSEFQELDETMPFLQYGEKGQHYGYELFLLPPESVYNYDEPVWWAYVARAFTFDKLPMDEKYLFEKYIEIAKQIGFRSLYYENDLRIEGHSIKGMASGVMSNRFIRNGWYTIRNRNRLYIKGIEEVPELYIEFALSRLDWYCSEYKIAITVNTDIDSFTFKAIFDASQMTEHQREVVSDLWGMFTGHPSTLSMISEKYGVTRNRIRQIERRACQHIIRGAHNPLKKHKGAEL